MSHGIILVDPMAFLRPVKGIKPLALDLSWRFVCVLNLFLASLSVCPPDSFVLSFSLLTSYVLPRPFNFGKTIPTDEEVAGIAKAIQPEDGILGHDEEHGKTAGVLLGLGTPSTSAESIQPTLTSDLPRVCEEFGTSPAPKRADESGHFEYLLTQRERTRASGVNHIPNRELEAQDDMDAEQGITPRSYDDGHEDALAPHEVLCHHEELRGSRDLLYPMEYHSQSLTDHGYVFDDSGIDTVMDNHLGQFPTSEFGAPLLLSSLQDVDTPATNKKNVDDQSENKENVPPEEVDGYHPAEDQPDPLVSQYDWSSYIEFPESQTPSFEPLSFASQSQVLGPSNDLTNSRMQDVPPLTPSARRVMGLDDHFVSTSECEQENSRVAKRRKLDDLVPTSSKDLFFAFIGLRNQSTPSRALERSEARNDASTPYQTSDVPEQILPRGTPDDVLDQHTVRLPEPWIPAATLHRYFASMTLIQKRALVRQLQGHLCRVDLVERYDLGGADIILDPDSCVLFISLFALPAHLESTVERISRESWRYLNLFVVLEAFPSAQGFRVDCSRDNRPMPYAYTPPICKAIKKLRRNLGIAEGCGTMNPRCTIAWAFANDVEEAAKFVRCFGEEACAISKERGHEILWDEREWLKEEEREVSLLIVFAGFLCTCN